MLRERFVREARHAQRVAHPNVIEIFDQGETEDGTPFLVMELLEGRSLADVIERRPAPARPRAAHRHRDDAALSPAPTTSRSSTAT